MEKKSRKVRNTGAHRNKSIEKEVLENRNSKKIEDIELDVISPKKKLFNGKTSNLKVKYKKDKKKYLLIVSSLFFVMALICGTSYAYLTYVGKTDNTTKIKVGTLAMTLKNESNEIVLEGAVPQEDKYALENNKEYEFTVENQGSLDSIYKIKLNNICNLSETFNVNDKNVTPDKCVPNEYIKVGLKKTDSTSKGGTIKGTPKVNGAVLNSDGMEFDGSSYIDMGNANYNFGSSITAAARFKLTEYTGAIQYLIGNPENGGFLLYVDANNNIRMGIYSSADSTYKYATTSSPKIELNKWYTVVGTYDGTNVKTYINGVKSAEVSLVEASVISTVPTLVGANPSISGEHSSYFNGTISDALVMNDVLTEEEIEENYSSGFNYYDNDKTLFYQNWNEKMYSDYDVLEYNEEDGDYVLDQDVLKQNEERSYKMKIWLDYDTPNDYNSQNMYNIVYAGALAVDYEQTKYQEVDVSYKVSFNANGGIGSMEDQTFAKGDKKTLSKNTFTKEGYTFVGWSTSSNGIVKYKDEEVVSDLANIENKVVKLYAVWSNNPQTVNVSVTTNGTVEIERLVDYGGDTDILLNATGYNNPTVTCTNNIKASARYNILKVTDVTNDTTCEVEYTPNTYQIEYDLSGGEVSGSLPEDATYDEEITISSPTKEGYGFAGWTSENIDKETAYYDDTLWTNGSTKALSETFKNLTSENNGKVTLKANWDNNVYTVKYDANTGIGTMDESYHAYNISSTLSKNIFTKKGYSFLGWSKDKDATTATYNDEASVLNIASEGEKEVTLYAVWQLKTKAITIKIAYNTSTYSGPSSTYKSDTYQKLSKSSTTLNYGTSETITASPAYPDDRYTGSVSCTNGITATITAGTGTTTRTDSVKLTNNSNTTTASTCTITYKPKWQGIAYGSYTAGNTLTYSGTSWTVKADNGSNTGLVLNSYAGSGAYKENVKTELTSKLSTDTAISDSNNGGLVEQSNGYYITTAGGISTGYTDANYWTDSTHFYNAATRTFYKTGTTRYLYGSWNGWGSGEVGYETVNTSVSSSATLSTGIKSTTSDYYTISGGTVTFKNATYSSASTNGYYSLRMTRFSLGSGSYNGKSDSPTSTQLAYLNYRYTYSSSDGYTLTNTALIGDTGRVTNYICGGSYHGEVAVYRYKSSTVFYYGNSGTGTGWSGSSWAVDNAVSYLYTSSAGERFNGRYAGYASTCGGMAANIDSDCVESTASNGDLQRIRRYRFHNWDDNYYCKKRTKYSLSNVEKTLYYRPYLKVRER